MTDQDLIALVVALLVMCIGLIGCVMPVIPGTPVILAAAIVHKIVMGSRSIGWFVILLLVGMTILSIVLDYMASMAGAKWMGATRKGMIGAVVGLLVGLFFSLPGILLGPFIGAGLFEMIGGREWRPAMKAGAGATLGMFAGTVGKLICCGLMMAIFTASVLWHVLR